MADIVETLEIRAVLTGFDEAVAKNRALGQGLDENNTKIAAGARGFEGLQRSLDPLYGAQQRFIDAQEKINRALASGQTDISRATQLLELNKARLAEASVATEGLVTAHGHAAGSSRALTEGLVLVHETLSGNYKRAMGSATIEAQALFGAQNLVAVATNPLVLGLVAAAAALAAIAVSSSRYRAEVEQLSLAQKTLSQGTGLTVDAMLGVAKSVSDAGNVSQDAARKIVIGIADIGGLGSKSFALVAQDAAAFGKSMGVDAVKGGEDLAKMLADPVKALTELDSRYQILDPTFKQYIENLVNSGHSEEARVAILERIGPKLDEINGHIHDAEGFWSRMATAIGNAYDNLAKFGTDPTIDERIARLQGALSGAAAQQATQASQFNPAPTQSPQSFGVGVSTGGLLNMGGAQASIDQANLLKGALNELDLEDLQYGKTLADTAATAAEHAKVLHDNANAADALANKLAPLTANTNLIKSEMTQLSDALAVMGPRTAENAAEFDKLSTALALDGQKLTELLNPMTAFNLGLQEQVTTLKTHAATLGLSSAAQLRATLTQQALKASQDELTKAGVQGVPVIDAVTKGLINQAVAAQGQSDAFSVLKTTVQDHTSALTKATDAMKAFDDKLDLKGLLPGAALLKDYNDKVTDLDARIATITNDLAHFSGTAAEHTKITLDLAKATDESTRAHADLSTAQQTAADLDQKAHDTAYKTLTDVQAEVAAIGLNDGQLRQFNETKKEAVAGAQIYAAVLAEQTLALHDVAAATLLAQKAEADLKTGMRTVFDAQQATADAAKVEHVWENTFEQVAKRIDTTITTSLADAFDGKKLTSWGDTLKQILSQVAAEIVNIALIRPVIGSALLSVGLPQAAQAFGVGAASGASGAAAGSATTGGSSLSTLGSGFSLGNIFGGGGTLSSTLFGGLDASGAATSGILPFSSGGQLFGTINPETGLAVGGVSGASLLTGAGGAAGIISGIMGLAGGNQNGVGILGSAASIGGGALALSSALGGPLLGLGASAGPIGLGIAAAGAVLSSLFGNKHPQHPTGQAMATFDAGGNIAGPFNDFTTDNGSAAGAESAVTGSILPLVQNLQKQYGLDLTGVQANFLNNAGQAAVGANRADSGNPGTEFFFDPNDAQATSDAFTKLSLNIIQNATAVSNADLAVARFNISIDDTSANIQKYIDFANNFSTTIAALNSGGGFDLSKSITGTAQQNATALFGQIQDFLDTTKKLFPDGSQIKQSQDAVKSYVETLIGLKQPVDSSLTTVEAAVKTLRANIDALSPVFDQVGISAAEAQKALAQGLASLKQQVNDSIQLQIDTIQRPGFATAEQALSTVASAFISNTKDAAATGADQAKVFSLALLQAGAAMQNLSQTDLQDLASKFIGSAPIYDAAIQALQGASSASAAAMTAIADSSQQMADSLNASAASIKATIESLLTGSLTALSPSDQLAEAQRQFQAAPDQNSAQTLLQLGQTFYGGATQNYADLFNSTLSTLASQGAFDAGRSAALANGGTGAAGQPFDAAARSDFLNGLPHFDKGTPSVPGPIGAPMLAVIHGGERITPANDNSNKAILAELQALRAEVSMLRGDTVNGSDKVARAVKPPASIQSTRKGTVRRTG